MKSPCISIVLPTYNGEKMLERAISSCLNQSFRDFELIIVDDCSTDGTLRVAEEFAAKDSRIIVVSNPVNLKLPASLNVGFEKAKGEFLTWTSDDNWYCPEALKRLYSEIIKRSADLVYSDYDVVDTNCTVVERKKLKNSEYLFSYNYIGACFLYRRSVYEKLGGYRTDLFCAEDYEYWLRIWTAGLKMEHIQESLYFYADNPCSLTATKRELILDKTIQLKVEYAKKVPVSRKTKVKTLFRLYRKKPLTEIKGLMIEIFPLYARYLLARYRLTGK